MYKTFTKFKPTTLIVAAAASLMLTATAVAGPKAGKVKPGKPGDNNILEIALAVNGLAYENEAEMVGEFAYLYGAVMCLQGSAYFDIVVGLLTGSDKYTLFAPTNEAFRNLQRTLTGNPDLETHPDITCSLENETLFTVLAYHLTDGRRFSNSVFNSNDPKEIEMLAAGSITTMPDLSIMDGSLQMVGLVLNLATNPDVSLVNVNASNGVIHTIDTVLLPAAD